MVTLIGRYLKVYGVESIYQRLPMASARYYRYKTLAHIRNSAASERNPMSSFRWMFCNWLLLKDRRTTVILVVFVSV